MDNEQRKKIHEINESTIKTELKAKKFYINEDYNLAYPMSHTARGFIDEALILFDKYNRQDLVEALDVSQVEIAAGIYLLDACGTSFSPLNKVLKGKLDALVSDRPTDALSDPNKVLLNFADRKVAAAVQKNLDEFGECYNYLRRNFFKFDFRHSELRSMMDVFSNSLHEYWRSFLNKQLEDGKLFKGSTPSHIFWGYNQFAVPLDIQVSKQKKSLANSKRLITERAAPGGFETPEEMREEIKKTKLKLKREEADKRKKSAQICKELTKKLEDIASMEDTKERTKLAYAWAEEYKDYLITHIGFAEDVAEDGALNNMENKVFFNR